MSSLTRMRDTGSGPDGRSETGVDRFILGEFICADWRQRQRESGVITSALLPVCSFAFAWYAMPGLVGLDRPICPVRLIGFSIVLAATVFCSLAFSPGRKRKRLLCWSAALTIIGMGIWYAASDDDMPMRLLGLSLLGFPFCTASGLWFMTELSRQQFRRKYKSMFAREPSLG